MEKTSCSLCNRIYSRSDALKRHFKVAHRIVPLDTELHKSQRLSEECLRPSFGAVKLPPPPPGGNRAYPPPPPIPRGNGAYPPPPGGNGVYPPPPSADNGAYPPEPKGDGVHGSYSSAVTSEVHVPVQQVTSTEDYLVIKTPRGDADRFIFKHPFTAVLARPTMSGKSTWMK